ncbi:MAG: hypothetical protein ACD_15C00064G0012 [uncultured bacterium]|nr:MAG: hypothetical protein ACD_15C00064G0012 [uncultured bacterium]HCU70780.1 hypothetical protein [Candidatus Moranbacteria bacterium]
MFRNQSTFVDENQENNNNLSQEKDYKIEDIIIHTMEKDIQEIENPSMKKTLYPEKSSPENPSLQLNEKQKSSPFLTPPEKSNLSDESRPKSKQDYAQINKIIQPKIDSNIKMSESSGSKKILLLLSFLIIIFVGIGTYYFITTRKSPENKIQSSPSLNIAQENPLEEKDTALTISAESPNYLVIDIASIDPVSLKKTLESKIQNIVTAKLKTPIEFTVVDKENNPISFSDFAKMADITLSAEILSSLEKKFSLFLFDDNGNFGVGLVLNTTDPLLANNQISQEETSLYKELASILPYSDFAIPTSPFESTQYKNHTIRYQNLISAQKLSIDYAFQGNKLIITTTKFTIESILDKANL